MKDDRKLWSCQLVAERMLGMAVSIGFEAARLD